MRAATGRTRRRGALAIGTIISTTAVAGLSLVSGATAADASTARPTARVVSAFPSDRLTVPDRSQLTGRRVALPVTGCSASPTTCNELRLIDQLDGFDLDPRLALRFDRAVDPAAVARATTVVGGRDHDGDSDADDAGGRGTGIDRVVYDAATHTVYSHPATQLAPGTTYRIVVHGSRSSGLPTSVTGFTTESATTGLLALRRQLDDGSAFHAAGIGSGAQRLRIEHVFPATGATLAYTADLGSGKTLTSKVLNTSSLAAGSYVFGSYLAPSWLDRSIAIPQTSTRGPGPAVTGRARVPFVLIVPSGTAPRGGWPVAVFGHGFTRTDADLFLAADLNASKGLATIATDVVGHGYGAKSTWTVTSAGNTTTFPAYARGFDQNHDGTITSTEGVSTPIQPAPDAAIGNRDGLRQTVADIMTLVRYVGRGVTVPAAGALGTATTLRPTAVAYYGQSFGGIYGVMLGGADPKVPVVAPNVSGGPISEIARLSPAFRPLVTQDLALRVPNLLNGGYDGFTESMPLRGDAPVTAPAPGSLAIQAAIADETWLNRSGSPETFAPLLRLSPPAGSPVKRVLFQNGFGDQTVPNPTTYTELAAGGLFGRESFYRNDKTLNAGSNPHGFLLNPTFVPGNLLAQRQMSTFLASGGTTTIDPDGPLPVFEVPITDPRVLLNLNFANPLHP